MNRYVLEMDDAHVEQLERMMKDSNARTKKVLINAALTLFAWAMKERKRGRIIGSIDEKNDSYKELVMPVLSEVGRFDRITKEEWARTTGSVAE
jgi:hypothetical protein